MENAIFEKYKVRGKFVDKVLGGLPANPELVETFLTLKGVEATDLESAQKIIETAQGLTTYSIAERNTTNIFGKDAKGLFLGSYQILGALKEAMSMQKSITNWRSKLQRGVRVVPSQIYLTRDEKPIEKADGVIQHVVHTTNMGQPTSSLRKSEYVDGPDFEFEVLVARERGTPIMSKDVLKDLLAQIEVTGIGASRGMGFGTSKLNLVE